MGLEFQGARTPKGFLNRTIKAGYCGLFLFGVAYRAFDDAAVGASRSPRAVLILTSCVVDHWV
jgi:hypothetical protein